MSKYFFVVILVFASANAIGQSKTTFSTPEQYCFSEHRPIKFVKGDTILVTCDSIFLMNSRRYTFYKSIHNAMLANDDSTCNKLLKAYELRLSEHQLTYERLLLNSTQAEKITLDLIKSSQISLSSTQEQLDFTQKSLESSLKNLELANQYIKKERWNSRGQKLLFGASGAGIGLLIGVLIMK